MSYSYQITNVPLSSDPTLATVTATLTDDSGQPQIIRNYSLPVANNPQPSDFATLIETDIDSLNASVTSQQALASALTGQSAVPVNTDAVMNNVQGSTETVANNSLTASTTTSTPATS